MKNKIFWRIILIFTFVLFLYSIFTKNVYITFISLIISILINYKGKNILFSDYGKKIEER